MFQRNSFLKAFSLNAKYKRLRCWSLLWGAAILGVSLVACAPAIEKNSDTTLSEDLSAATDELAADITMGNSDEFVGAGADTGSEPPTQEREILLIEPRPDRETPLRDCGNLTKQQEMNACASENYQTVDAELNEAYQQIKNALSDAGKQSLETAELAWVEFRDLDCGFERSQFEGGSIAPLIYYSCLEARTNIRINELYDPVVAESSYAAADSALNAAYQGLTKAVSDRRDEGLVDAQLAWIEYRDRHCDFEANYGAADIEADQCKARLSEKRTRQIRAAVEQNSL